MNKMKDNYPKLLRRRSMPSRLLSPLALSIEFALAQSNTRENTVNYDCAY